MSKELTFSVLVNTSDNFEDCWNPFFELFNKYWKNFHGTIYLNTENKEFKYPGLNIISVKNNNYYKKKRITWSECVINALELIEEKIVLQLFEDNFLIQPVDQAEIERIVQLMLDEKITFVGLGPSVKPAHKTIYRSILEVDQYASYRINTQPALWNVNLMKKYLRAHEDPWYFEMYGTKRAHLIKDKIYNIDIENCKMAQVFAFCEGIRKGKWDKQTVRIFDENNIKIDFSHRGFFENNRKSFVQKLINRLKIDTIRNTTLSNFGIYLLKLKKTFSWDSFFGHNFEQS